MSRSYRSVISSLRRGYTTGFIDAPIVSIKDATFYRKYPSALGEDATSNPAMFPTLNFAIPSFSKEQQYWAIVGPSNAGKTTFCKILCGQYICFPPAARSFPYLSSCDVDPRYRSSGRAIQYVGFDGERGGVGRSGTRGAYLSARYESRRDDTDFSVMDFLQGNTDLNPLEQQGVERSSDNHLKRVIDDLNLEALVSMPMGNLSNGQTRRARIAKALLGKPLVLLLDEPFMGLDPPTTESLSPLLYNLAKNNSPRLVLGLRPQDPLPDWITHTIDLSPALRIHYMGKKAVEALGESVGSAVAPSKCQSPAIELRHFFPPAVSSQTNSEHAEERSTKMSAMKFAENREKPPTIDSPRNALKPSLNADPYVKMENIVVRYKNEVVLGEWHGQLHPDPEKVMEQDRNVKGLHWSIYPGQRWGLFGPNGSGKTTLISLICSDHPQTYSLSIEIFGRKRLPQRGKPGISVFDIQAKIGQSSPEIHAFFPRNLSIRQTLENAWADTFLGTPHLDKDKNDTLDVCLRWFEPELNPLFNSPVTDPEKTQKDTKKGVDTPHKSNTVWADTVCFGDTPFSTQRVALFLRAIIKKSPLIVLDEAFSGMDEYVRDKCMLFLIWGECKSLAIDENANGRKRYIAVKSNASLVDGNGKPRHAMTGLEDKQALICVSHVKDECPDAVSQWICLPEPASGKAARFGTFPVPLREDVDNSLWSQIWSK